MSFVSTSQVLKLKLAIALVKVEIRQKMQKKKTKRKRIVRFINKKHGKITLINRKALINISKSSLSLSSSDSIFINEIYFQ